MSSCFVVDLDARPWDFQAEECALRANIERFNARRYDRAHSNPDFLPVDNCLQSVLGQRVDLPEDFQMNYDLWLEREVFSKPISWEELLQWVPGASSLPGALPNRCPLSSRMAPRNRGTS